MENTTLIADWRQILRQNFTNWEALANFLELYDQQREKILQKPNFILSLPRRLANKIEKGTLDDPILKQFLPTVDEKIHTPGFASDPHEEKGCLRGPKLLQKYKRRVLLVCTGACALHCRYCFRQNFSYKFEKKTFEEEIDIITKDPSIHEVVLSGGDPLALSNAALRSLLNSLSVIPHIRGVRFHTRFPIGIPERIDDSFLQMIEELPQQVWFVIHCNHPRELDETVFSSLRALQKRGVIVLNQAVLLRGVNDDVDTLRELCETLIDQGVLPYYLHQLDRVQGAAHFEVPETKGLQLIKELNTLLPGFAVPKYVREITGEPNKTPIIKH